MSVVHLRKTLKFHRNAFFFFTDVLEEVLIIHFAAIYFNVLQINAVLNK